jgi:hypothetical protein
MGNHKNILKKLFGNKFFINLFPVFIIHLLLIPFWIVSKYSNFVYVPFELFYDTIINPVYLVVVNMIYSIKFRKANFILNIFLMAFSCLIGNLLYYLIWGISTGGLLNPDWGTGMLFGTMLMIIPIIIIIGIIEQIIIIFLYKLKWKKELL